MYYTTVVNYGQCKDSFSSKLWMLLEGLCTTVEIYGQSKKTVLLSKIWALLEGLCMTVLIIRPSKLGINRIKYLS